VRLGGAVRRHSFQPAGAELTLAIRCQTPTGKIDMNSGIAYEGGRLTMIWLASRRRILNERANSLSPTPV
jgi:hypothetical protein